MRILNIGNRAVNNYLIETPQGWLVIDTGYAGNFNRFCKGLKKHNINLDSIKYIFITHAHDDHVGFLNELMDATEAILVMHQESPQRLLEGHNRYKGGCSNLLAKIFVNCMGFIGISKHEFPIVKVPTETLLWDGSRQFFKEKGLDIDILPLTGHTSDHIGLLIGENLFCGDASMNGFPSIKRNIIWIEDLESYRSSWEIMINTKANTIYPSHGKPFPKSDLIRFRENLKTIKLHKTKLSIE